MSSDVPLTSCGVTATRSLNQRSYLLRLPAHAGCKPGHPLPLAVLIHCFGCMASMEIAKFAAAADQLGFALAAPEGVESSFNAPHCCGAAHHQEVDDVGFVDAVVSDLLAERGNGPRFLASALFAAGFSNGGFLASHLADASHHAWAALAPAAGHEYNLRRKQPLPIVIHHCRMDSKVNASGCCLVPGDGSGHLGGGHSRMRPTCCCGIVAETCVSTEQIFSRWLYTVNKCTGVRDLAAHRTPGGAAVCSVGVGCAADTMLCWYADGCVHSDWARHFPAAEATLAFFAKVACEQHGGKSNSLTAGEDWSPPAERCRCPRGREGITDWHCLHQQLAAQTAAP